MPVMGNIGNINYVLTTIVGSLLATGGIGGLTLGGLASFLQLTRSFNQPITQIAQQFNSIIMALAGAERIFNLMDEPSEQDGGYVTLVNARYEGDKLVEVPERTGIWAWKHPHHDGTITYTELKGDVVMDGVDFGYTPEKTVLHDIKLYAKPRTEGGLRRRYRSRKNDHYQPDQPVLRYSGRKDPLRRYQHQ